MPEGRRAKGLRPFLLFVPGADLLSLLASSALAVGASQPASQMGLNQRTDLIESPDWRRREGRKSDEAILPLFHASVAAEAYKPRNFEPTSGSGARIFTHKLFCAFSKGRGFPLDIAA
jgi:hypothetical protein